MSLRESYSLGTTAGDIEALEALLKRMDTVPNAGAEQEACRINRGDTLAACELAYDLGSPVEKIAYFTGRTLRRLDWIDRIATFHGG